MKPRWHKFYAKYSGLKRSLTDVLFSAKPKDMPSALALAQEVESNHERLHHLFQEAGRIGTKNYFRRRKSANRPILMLIRNQDSNLKWIYLEFAQT